MRHFATESGKNKGQFYTPAEVSRIMAMVIDLGKANRSDQSIYDPTCGSGSLLLKAHDEAKGRTGLDLALYGQEMDNATSALARMNMVLHDCPTAEVWQANTLSSPHFKNTDGGLKTFDFVVANFPFSNKNWASGLDPVNDLYRRFEYGIPPAKNGDYAFPTPTGKVRFKPYKPSTRSLLKPTGGSGSTSSNSSRAAKPAPSMGQDLSPNSPRT